MAVLTAIPISALAVELLVRSIVLPRTVSRVPGTDFAGPAGGSAVIRVPVPRVARVQTTPGDPVVVDPITEVPVTIAVTHIYDACRVTDEDLNLSIEDFGRQVLEPQTAAVATRAEIELAGLLNARTPTESFPADPVDLADEGFRRQLEDAILLAGESLDTADVPQGNRFAAVSPSVARRLSRIDKFTRVDTTGRTDALAEATLGKLHGFDFVKSNSLTAGTAHFYHRSAFGMGWLAPAVGHGVGGGVAQSQGIALTSILQYDANTLRELSVIHTYVGSAEVDAARVVSFNTTP